MSNSIWSGPLFSTRRLFFLALLSTFVVGTDYLFIHLSGIETTSELVTEILILTLGLYGGTTIMALFSGKSL